MTPWQNETWYVFDKGSVNARAPSASGVYALKGADGGWIYVGESATIASSLLRHLAGSNSRVIAAHPATFSFEPCGETERKSRRDALVLELQPTCNRRLE